jgi:hypothetical protein
VLAAEYSAISVSFSLSLSLSLTALVPLPTSLTHSSLDRPRAKLIILYGVSHTLVVDTGEREVLQHDEFHPAVGCVPMNMSIVRGVFLRRQRSMTAVLSADVDVR